MARLGTPATAPAHEPLRPGTVWQAQTPLNAYSRAGGMGLATQVRAGRHLQVLDRPLETVVGARLRVRLLEDGYPCWLSLADLQTGACAVAARPLLPRLGRACIEARLATVLGFAQAAAAQTNRYLWGGTLGPDYDCSGLVQSSYAAAGIWLPRDAYLQERFCRPVAVRPGEFSLLQPGDLIFFGRPRRCTHVGLHLGGGRFLHSSGQEHGRDGIGVDDLHPRNRDPVAVHYRGELRGAGRVMHSHDGSPQPG